MEDILFRISFCSMISGSFFSEKIRVHGAVRVVEMRFFRDELAENNIVHMSDLITYIKATRKEASLILDAWGKERFVFSNVYIRYKGSLVGLQDDKSLMDIAAFFKHSTLEVDYLFVPGGASIHCNGYLFVVHPDEAIHRYQPHVHVRKGNQSVRYLLDTFEKMDKAPREFLRDEKKIILPALQEKKQRLYDCWNLYMNGYIPPAEDENGMQFYRES